MYILLLLYNFFIDFKIYIEFLYKTTNYYHPQSEACLAWNDPNVGIEWPLPAGIAPNMNAKDLAGLPWEKAPKF